METVLPYKLKLHDIAILLFVYRFRFLTTTQLQYLLQRKSHSRLVGWLSILAENKYLIKFDDPVNVTVPTVYSLGTKGRKYFKLEYTGKGVNLNLLDRVWQEYNYSKRFRKECIFTAFLYLSLVSLTNKTGATVRFHTNTDLKGMKHFVSPLPSAFFSITEKKGSTKRYFVDIFQYIKYTKKSNNLTIRVRTYFSYYKKGEWQRYNKNPFPNIIFITTEKSYQRILAKEIKKYLRINTPLQFYLAIWDDIQKQGINKSVLHKVI